MKKLVFYLFAICLSLSSCQTEDALLNNENADLSLQIETPGIDRNGMLEGQNRKGGGEEIDVALLESRMHWFSFITAKMLRESPTYQSEFITHLGTGNTIPAGDLIGDSPFVDGFNIDFRDHLIYYIDESAPDPDDEPAKPNPPGGGLFMEIDPRDLANEIIDYLVNIHCVELYFPVGLDFSITPYTMTSTAHSLTSIEENEGYVRLYTPVTLTDPRTGESYSYVTVDVTVNAAYLNSTSNDMVVLARPVKFPLSSGICEYNDFSDIDFTDFLGTGLN